MADDHDWSPATVKTMMHRLVKKNVLAFNREGNRYLYRVQVRRTDCVCRAVQSFLNMIQGGETAPMLAHFVSSGQLSTLEISELKRLLDELEDEQCPPLFRP